MSTQIRALGFGPSVSVRLARIASLVVLRQRIAEYAHGQLLGSHQEHQADYWLATSPAWPDAALGIAVIVGMLGPRFAARQQEPRLLFVGHNRGVSVLALPNLGLLNEHRFTTPFFEFVPTTPEGPLLVILEADVVAMGWGGHKRWERRFPEILTGWSVAGDDLRLQFFDGTQHIVRWMSGADSAT